MVFGQLFWTFVGSGLPSSSNAAEIDIFEMTGSDAKAPHIVGTNIHKDYCDCDNYTCDGCDYIFEPICPDYNSSILCHGQDLIPFNFNYTTWHSYGIEWSPSKIIWYIDGFPVRLFPNHGVVDPVRIILNLAIEPGFLPNSSTPFQTQHFMKFKALLKSNLSNNTKSINHEN